MVYNNIMKQIQHGSKTYNVALPTLTHPLQVFDGVSLLHPVDCIRLGVHNSGYFVSNSSVLVHNGAGPRSILAQYFTAQQVFAYLPELYQVAYETNSAVSNVGDHSLNHFKVSASKEYQYWLDRGWIHSEFPEGWFEVYCAVVAGVLSADSDIWKLELKRAKSCIARHAGQVAKNLHRTRQRQCLLNWASPLAFVQ